MSEYKVVTATPQSLASGAAALASVTKRGELITMPWHVQLANEGKVFVTAAGTETAPITLGNTVIDNDQPEFILRVPTGTTVIPLFAQIVLEATGGALFEGGMTVEDSDPTSGTSTAADQAPTNMKSRGAGSTCTARQLVTANLTQVALRWIWRAGEPADLDSAVGGNRFNWNYMDQIAPVLVGPAAVMLYAANGTSGTGFITLIFAEFVGGIE